MLGWLMLILFIILVLIVWISLVANTKRSKTNFYVDEQSPTHHGAITISPQRSSESDIEQISAHNNSPRKTAADDLTIVEGIGPKVRLVLSQAGIITLRQLGETENARLRQILDDAKYPYMNPDTWPGQAILADEGKMGELRSLQEQLRVDKKK